nr:uncharacterized protein LOC109148036 [Ipomoea batatas]
MRRGKNTIDPVKFLCVLVSIVFTFILFISILKIHELPVKKNNAILSWGGKKIKSTPKDAKVGKFGGMVIEMLPEDLAFTLFLPSEKAFERDLGLRLNESLAEVKVDDTNAVLTRVLGFSALPRIIYSENVVFGEEISYDSLSGFTLLIVKDSKGSLVVNGVRSEMMDLWRGKIVVHVMDGVLMDAEFEQSVRPDFSGGD